MKGLKACLKKEWLECGRGKRLFVYFGVAAGMFLLSIGMVYLLDFVSSMVEGEGFSAVSYPLSLNGVLAMYNSNMLQIFSFVLIFTLMGCVSKEISAKKWVLPVCSGVKPSDMVLSKFIVQTGFATLAALVGFFLTAVFGALFIGKDLSFLTVLLKGGAMVIFLIFIAVLTISLSSLTKNSAIAAVVPIFVLMFLPLIFEVAKIAEYTPVMFYNYANAFLFDLELSAAEIAAASVSTASVLAALIALSVLLSDKYVKLI